MQKEREQLYSSSRGDQFYSSKQRREQCYSSKEKSNTFLFNTFLFMLNEKKHLLFIFASIVFTKREMELFFSLLHAKSGEVKY